MLRAFLDTRLVANNLKYVILGVSIITAVSIYACSTRYSKSERFSYAFDHWTGREVKHELSSPPARAEKAASMPMLNSFEEKLVKAEPNWGSWDIIKTAPTYTELPASDQLRMFDKWQKRTREAFANFALTDPAAFQAYQKHAEEIENEFNRVRTWLVVNGAWEKVKPFLILGLTAVMCFTVWKMWAKSQRPRPPLS